jgi:hypothetical protein
MRYAAALCAGALIATAAAAQADTRARLAGRVPPAVVITVDSIASALAARSLPSEPVVQKALEGGAKGVAAERIVAAAITVATRIEVAAAAVSRAGLPPTIPVVEAATFALSTGLPVAAVESVAAVEVATPDDAAVALSTSGTLAALGVPPDAVVQLVLANVRAGVRGRDIAALARELQQSMARGATPAQAAAGLSRAATARERRGPPPERPVRPKPSTP